MKNEIVFGIIVILVVLIVITSNIYITDYFIDTLNKRYADCRLESGDTWECSLGEVSCFICVLPFVVGAVILMGASYILLKEETP